MNNRNNGLTTLMFSALVAFAGLWGMWNDPAPEVEFVTLEGEHVRLSELRGHPVLVTFWASDCRSCLQEIPDLAMLYRDYSAHGFETVAVAMAYDPPNRVVEAVKKSQVPYKVALDPLGRIAAAFGHVQQVPSSFLIAPNGRIALRKLGRIQAEELRVPVERMLRKV
jgi:peroxiredoxin